MPVDNYTEGDGSLRVEKEKEEEAKRLQKKAKTAAKPKTVPALTKSTDPVMVAGTWAKRRRKVAKEETEIQQKDNFLRNEPSPGAVTTDVIGTISRGVPPRETGKVITNLLSNRSQQGGEVERQCQ